MNKKMILLTGVVLMVVLAFAAMPMPASADGGDAADIVFASGLGTYCETFDFFDSHYKGPATRVTKENGKIFQTCAMKLVSGEPVSEVTRFTYVYSIMTCDFVATPGGTLNATCRFP